MTRGECPVFQGREVCAREVAHHGMVLRHQPRVWQRTEASSRHLPGVAADPLATLQGLVVLRDRRHPLYAHHAAPSVIDLTTAGRLVKSCSKPMPNAALLAHGMYRHATRAEKDSSPHSAVKGGESGQRGTSWAACEYAPPFRGRLHSGGSGGVGRKSAGDSSTGGADAPADALSPPVEQRCRCSCA